MELTIKDGSRLQGRYDPVLRWYVVRDWAPELGDEVIIDGIQREVALVVEMAGGETAIHVFPDLNQPSCKGCGGDFQPPRPDDCRFRCPRGFSERTA